MGLKNDRWIKEMAVKYKIIEPFVEKQVEKGVVSYGLSSYGYDLRVANHFKILKNRYSADDIIDPKIFEKSLFEEVRNADYCVIPPNSFVLGRSVEYLRIPRNVLAYCLPKSTYNRVGIIVNGAPPLEPEWEGFINMTIINALPLPVKIYSNEGLVQVVFWEADEVCEVSYNDKQGKYQKQTGINEAMIKKI